MNQRTGGRVLFSALLLVGVVGTAPGAASASDEPDGRGGGLLNGDLRAAVQAVAESVPLPTNVDAAGTRIRVEVLSSLPVDRLTAIVEGVGGSVEGAVPGVLVQALVPAGQLAGLEARADIDYLQPPADVNVPTAQSAVAPAPEFGALLGEHVNKTKASLWHAAGFTGTGIKIGVVDSFTNAGWTAAQAAGEVPALPPANVFCRANGSNCPALAVSGSNHGVSVSEVVIDAAPGTTLYIASALTTADLQAVVDYFISQGVDIITRSLTSPFDGPGNGTGPLATVIDNAVAGGITWFNSAGNNAGVPAARLAFTDPAPTRYGSYWRGVWTDTDGDNYLDFAQNGATPDEFLGFNSAFMNGLRWDDFDGDGSTRTDYDFEVYNGMGNFVSQSINNQVGGAPPIERPPSCAAGTSFFKVKLFAAGGGGTAGDILEIAINGAGMEYYQNANSAASPASDTNSPGALSVGAVGDTPRGGGTTIANYSSQGPSNDGRIKPDLSGASCMTTFTDGVNCFNGTSSSTPVVAGLAALVIQSGQATTPAQVKTAMLNKTVERGVAGADNVFGEGEVILGNPTCTDDAMEDNDTRQTASPSASGVAMPGTLCSHDEDWFAIEAVAGQPVMASANHTFASGNLNLRLFDPTGAQVAASETGANLETVSVNAAMTGTYTAQVFGVEAAQNSYSFTFQSATCTPDDSFEPNDGVGSATSITAGSPRNGVVCPTNEDFYSFSLARGDNLQANVSFLNALGNLSAQLLDGTGAVISTAATTNNGEQISLVAARAGTYVLRIFSADGNPNTYSASIAVTAGTPPAGFTAVSPERVFDTRPGESPSALRVVAKTKIGGDNILEVQMTDLTGLVPATGVGAVSLNVVVTNTEGNSFVTVYPCGPRQLVSSLNFGVGQTVANAVIAPVSATGTVCFYSPVNVDILADVNGWFATGQGFTPVSPERVFDTRPGESPGALRDVGKLPVSPANVIEVQVTDLSGVVPATGVGAVSLNVVATNTAGPGFLTIFPCGVQPVVSSLNYLGGQTVANAVIAPVSPTGTICFFSSQPADVLADINGWFANGSDFVPITPARVFDTRAGESPDALRNVVKARIGGDTILEVQVTDLAPNVPASGVEAVSLNVVAINPSGAGFVTLYPCGPRKVVSSLNYAAGQTVANAVIAPVSPTGTVCFYSLVPVDIIADINGWFAG